MLAAAPLKPICCTTHAQVPEGEWLCPDCDAGAPPQRPSQLATYWQRMLYGDKVVGLVHIMGFTQYALSGEMT